MCAPDHRREKRNAEMPGVNLPCMGRHEDDIFQQQLPASDAGLSRRRSFELWTAQSVPVSTSTPTQGQRASSALGHGSAARPCASESSTMRTCTNPPRIAALTAFAFSLPLATTTTVWIAVISSRSSDRVRRLIARSI